LSSSRSHHLVESAGRRHPAEPGAARESRVRFFARTEELRLPLDCYAPLSMSTLRSVHEKKRRAQSIFLLDDSCRGVDRASRIATWIVRETQSHARCETI
jgi:hypothetical protein